MPARLLRPAALAAPLVLSVAAAGVPAQASGFDRDLAFLRELAFGFELPSLAWTELDDLARRNRRPAERLRLHELELEIAVAAAPADYDSDAWRVVCDRAEQLRQRAASSQPDGGPAWVSPHALLGRARLQLARALADEAVRIGTADPPAAALHRDGGPGPRARAALEALGAAAGPRSLRPPRRTARW